MDVFGPTWADHPQRVISAWRDAVGENDPVLVPGEQIEEIHCRKLAEYFRKGLKVQGVTEKDEYCITVVKNQKK